VRFLAAASVILLAGASGAPAPPLSVQAQESPQTIQAGTGSVDAITFHVASGFHVQANPAADEFLIPLTVKLVPGPGLKVGDPKYPAPEKYRLHGTDVDLLTYSGTFSVGVPLNVTADARAGAVTLSGSVRYQACDRRSCKPPATIEFKRAYMVEP
jgi:hypothetical protein